jgi:serine protease AprX
MLNTICVETLTKSSKKNSPITIGIFLIISFFTQMSYAGEKLILQSGEFKIVDLKNQTRFGLDSTSDISATAVGTKSSPQYFIVQFKNAISPADENQLREIGFQILRYVPEDAYIVKGTSALIEKAKNQIQTINDFIPYVANFRMSSGLQVRSVFNRDVVQSVVLHLFPGVNANELAEQLVAKGVQVNEVSDGTIHIQATNNSLPRIASIEGVEWVSKKSQMELKSFVIPSNETSSHQIETSLRPDTLLGAGDFSDISGYESGTKVMGFEKAWNNNIYGSNQIVGISDTGLDTGNKSTLARDFGNLKDSYALGYASQTWADYVGHGSHVSGSVAGNGEESNRMLRGGAYGARLIMQSLWSQKYKNLTTPDDLKVIFQQAYDSGARVHSNSWGDTEGAGQYTAESNQVDQFVWDHPHMVILFAAANEGVDSDRNGRVDPGSISPPATSKNVITVGASENLVRTGGVQKRLGDVGVGQQKPWPVEPLASDTLSNDANGLAAFSSRGPTQDGRIKPDVVAPGTNILSNCSKMPGAEVLWGRYNNDYCWSGGTSMSTPLTAGAAAVVRERLMRIPELSAPSAAMIKAVLMHTATDLYPGQYGEVGESRGQEILKPGPNSDQGYGRVNVDKAVAARLNLVDEKTGVATGETKVYDTQSALRKITLIYNDAPSSLTAGKVLVNNLDLEVQVNGQSLRSESSLNNSEQIVLPQDSQGAVRIIVKGANVPMGKNGRQPFALVFSL